MDFEHHILRLAYDPDFAPFCFNDGNKARGLLIDRANTVFDCASISQVLIPTRLSDMSTDLASGRVDALLGIASSPERKILFEFSKPLIISGASLFRKNNSIWADNDNLLQDHDPIWRVITPANGPLVDVIPKHFPLVQVLTCESYADALQGVLDGAADAAALNWHVGRMLCTKNHAGMFKTAETPFLELALNLATPVEDPGNLFALLNQHIPDEWGSIDLTEME